LGSSGLSSGLLSFDFLVLIQPLYIVFDGLSHRIFSALTRRDN
jgi:hypothetical protein